MLGLTPSVTRLTNRDVATMMVAVSDNSATNVLIDKVGMQNVNAMLDSFGLSHTRLRRKMIDTRASARGDENTATPREAMRLMEILHRGEVINRALSDDVRRIFEAFFSAGTRTRL